MKVLGKFIGGYNSRSFAVGAYVAFDAEWVCVKTYTGASIDEDYNAIPLEVEVTGIYNQE